MTPGRTSHPEEGIRDFCEVIQEDGGGRTPHFQTAAFTAFSDRRAQSSACFSKCRQIFCHHDAEELFPGGDGEELAVGRDAEGFRRIVGIKWPERTACV